MPLPTLYTQLLHQPLRKDNYLKWSTQNYYTFQAFSGFEVGAETIMKAKKWSLSMIT